MSQDPLHIAFVWHMHQPLYKDPLSGEYALPWVRLHGTKDYYDMAAILEKYPNIHQTFNIVPSLTEQIIDYAEGRARDRFLDITAKSADELTIEDKRFILSKFFFANWENMIMIFPRYGELLKKRGFHTFSEDADAVLRYYTQQDFLDLQVLFNLSWIDPTFRGKDRFLKGLAEKGRDFTEGEKLKLIEKQMEILKAIIPEYKKLQDSGIIELSTSPYYHPILPLLCDTNSAKEAMPWAELPNSRFAHPEDALEQIKRGIALHKKVFGNPPKGMWPPEGSVSEQVIPIIAGEGINWIATDEEILAQSLGKSIKRDGIGHCLDPHILYKPYKVSKDGKELSIIFRDHILSDLVGFVYSKWDAEKAADDFIGRLMYIRNSLGDNSNGHLVTIVLDGENAWEYYKNDANDFFNALYSKMAQNHLIKAVTVSEHLKEHSPNETLPRLFSGSWINHNFKIWIGHIEDNTAWDHLSEARDVLASFENGLMKKSKTLKQEDRLKLEKAWEEIYAAEGSDWFWWYGEDHSSMNDIEFDDLFRKHLKKMYLLLDKESPAGLDIPIISEEKVYEPLTRPTSFMSPVIDGEITNYFEWLSSGRIEIEEGGAAMHREKKGGGVISSINYGFDIKTLFFRFDFVKGIAPSDAKWGFTIDFIHPKNYKAEVDINGLSVAMASILGKDAKGGWVIKADIENIAVKDVVELAIPFKNLGLKSGDEMRFFITIVGDNLPPERWPRRGYIIENIPDKDFELYNWRV